LHFPLAAANWQPEAQTFPTLNNGAAFPASHGQAASFFLASTDAQLQFAYVPDDFSSTYIITHWTSPSTAGSTDGAPDGISSFINSTQILPAPSSKDTASVYAASTSSLVQLTSSGELYYINALPSTGGYAVAGDAAWAKIGYTASGGNSSTGGSSSTGSASAASATGSKAASVSGSAAAASKTVSKAVSSASASVADVGGTSAGEREIRKGAVGIFAGVLGAAAFWVL
jgi:hypothetical protein